MSNTDSLLDFGEPLSHNSDLTSNQTLLIATDQLQEPLVPSESLSKSGDASSINHPPPSSDQLIDLGFSTSTEVTSDTAHLDNPTSAQPAAAASDVNSQFDDLISGFGIETKSGGKTSSGDLSEMTSEQMTSESEALQNGFSMEYDDVNQGEDFSLQYTTNSSKIADISQKSTSDQTSDKKIQKDIYTDAFAYKNQSTTPIPGLTAYDPYSSKSNKNNPKSSNLNNLSGDSINLNTQPSTKSLAHSQSEFPPNQPQSDHKFGGDTLKPAKVIGENVNQTFKTKGVVLDISQSGALLPPKKGREDGTFSPGSDGDLPAASDEPNKPRLEDTLADFVPPKRYEKKEPEKKESRAPGLVIMGASDSICKQCGKRVYEMEKIIADKNIFHRMCFKCNHCKRVLNLVNYASLDGKLWCKPHFVEIFKTKGNYEEGFGMERHTKQWQKPESGESGGVESTAEQLEKRRMEQAQVEQEHESPSIRNLKNRFEDRSDENGIAKETREKEEVRFNQMNDVRRMFQSDSTSGAAGGSVSPSQPKRVSKWDKPKTVPPPPVNRRRDSLDDDQPAGDEVDSSGRRLPRRITPPREHLEADISAAAAARVTVANSAGYERDPSIVTSDFESRREAELPPPKSTRSLLEKFKSIERDAPPPVPTPATGATTAASAPAVSMVTAADPRAVSRETDDEDVRPEQGSTRSLLEQWRSKEGDGPPPTATSSHITSPPQRSASRVNGHAASHVIVTDGVTRESDVSEADALPPPSYTKNLLAKFQSIETDSRSAASDTRRNDGNEASAVTADDSRPPKKFRWTVKEPRILNRTIDASHRTPLNEPTAASTDAPLSNGTSGDAVLSNGTSTDVAHTDTTDEHVTSGDELPPPRSTLHLLAKFKSMEDVNKPPPSPAAAPPSAASKRLSARQQSLSSAEQMHNGYVTGDEHTSSSDVLTSSDAPVNGSHVSGEESTEREEMPEKGITRNLLQRFTSLTQ